MLLHNELQYEIANVFHRTSSPNRRPCFSKSPNTFLQITEHVSPNRRTCFSKSPNMFFQITEHFSPNRHRISPNKFLQITEHVSPNHRTRFSKSSNMFLQIAIVFRQTGFSKSPTTFHQISNVFRRTGFSKSPTMFSPYLWNVSPTTEQHTFCSVLYGEDPVSDLSLHMLRAPCSVLWVVGCGSLVTPVPPTHARAPRSTLWTMG